MRREPDSRGGLEQRLDAPHGLNLYAYTTVPCLYGQFLAYMLYRWEIVIRHSARFGILGIGTFSYCVDAANSELQVDAAFFLILVTVALAICVDMLWRNLRNALRVERLPKRVASITRRPNPVGQVA